MKTVKQGSEVRRVSDEDSVALVSKGWSYCPKSVWKSTKKSAPKAVVGKAMTMAEVAEEILLPKVKKPKKKTNKQVGPRNPRNA